VEEGGRCGGRGRGGTSRQGSNSPRGKRVMRGSGREAVGEGKREAQRSAPGERREPDGDHEEVQHPEVRLMPENVQ
jgi:hypothetical protein